MAEVNTFYGISQALFGVSFRVNKGEAICLLGRNGAGKTTTLKSIIGLIPPQSGSIRFKGEEIVNRQPYEITRFGYWLCRPRPKGFPDLDGEGKLRSGYQRTERQKELDH